MTNLPNGISLKNGMTGLTTVKPGSKFSVLPAPKPAAVPFQSKTVMPRDGYNPAQVGLNTKKLGSPYGNALSSKLT